MLTIFDSHAHYDDPKFDPDRDEVLRAAFAVGVRRILNAAVTPRSARASLDMAERYPQMVIAAGVHPENIAECAGLEQAMDELRDLLRHPKTVAIGEIGLDYHWKEIAPALQKEWLEAQLALAKETGYPVIIHDREAHGDCMEAVARFPTVTGVFHSFSGSAEMAKDLIRRGWYISFSGTVTFKNARQAPEAAAVVPMDRILTETDCPYLTPHPHRGERNFSGYLPHTIEALATVKGVTPEEMARATYENACRLFRLPTEAEA